MKKEKKYSLFKGLLILLLLAFFLSWIFEKGELGSAAYSGEGMKRLGLTDVPWLIYGSIYYSFEKIILLLSVGGLYGVLTKTSAYERLVSNVSSKVSKHPKIFTVLISLLIAALTSVLSEAFVVIIFIPFIIAIMNKLKFDKITILSSTFGSMIIGIMGATYGTEGLLSFNNYMSGDISNNILIRLAILLIGVILFNFFIIQRINKKELINEEMNNDLFLLEPIKETKRKTIIPIIICFTFLFILVILGYFNWPIINVSVFDNFHELITSEIKIGKDFYIFKDLLGTYITALGTWELSSIITFILLFTLIIALCYKIKFNDFLTSYIDGIKKFVIPIAFIIGINMMLSTFNTSNYLPIIIDKILSLSKNFNIITMTIVSLLTSLLNPDLGFTGFVLGYGGYISSKYPDYVKTINSLIPVLYGFAQLFVPTSVILYVGLSSLKVKYTEWLKFIWHFMLGMFVCIMVIFVLMITVF